MIPIDLDKYRLPAEALKSPKLPKRAPRPRRGEQYLRGPIPWPWLSAAARLPGKTLHVAVAIWFVAGLKNNRTIRFRPAVGRGLGLSRYAAYTGLAALEKLGLIQVDRQRGRSPIITIVDVGFRDQICDP